MKFPVLPSRSSSSGDQVNDRHDVALVALSNMAGQMSSTGAIK